MSTGMQGCLAELVLIMKMSSVITKQIKLNAITYFKWKRSQTLRKLSVRLWDFWIPRALPSIWATTCQKTCWNLWRHLNRAVPSGKEINTQNRFLCIYRSACTHAAVCNDSSSGMGGVTLVPTPTAWTVPFCPYWFHVSRLGGSVPALQPLWPPNQPQPILCSWLDNLVLALPSAQFLLPSVARSL